MLTLTARIKTRDIDHRDLGRVPQVGDEIVLASAGRGIKVRVTSVYRRGLDKHGKSGIRNVYADEI